MIKTAMLRQIYPDLSIYETDVGQNWQILLPVAGRGKCGYIDEAQYHIAVRRDSHSRSVRTLAEEVARRMELKKVLLIGIEKSGRNDRDYQTIVDLKYLHILNKIYLDAAAYDRAKECYEKLKQSNDVKPEEYRSYLQVWHPAKYRLYCAVDLVRRAWGKIKRTILK